MTFGFGSVEILDEILVGRVKPKIYAFETHSVPNHLKVGDTYRPVTQRLREWARHYPQLEKKFEASATITDDIYFRDHAVHSFLVRSLKKSRLDTTNLSPAVYPSREFFLDTKPADVEEAIADIHHDYKTGSSKYTFYDAWSQQRELTSYERSGWWQLRPNQAATVRKFKEAVEAGRTNLLMYAVMRFGKTFTALCCALEMDAKLTVVVSAKADVRDEWKKTVETAENFADFVFIDAESLDLSKDVIERLRRIDKRVIVFLTLQDLQGEEIKERHTSLFRSVIDLVIVDETHFGAHADKYGAVLQEVGLVKDNVRALERLDDDQVSIDIANQEIKKLNSRIRLHLSGTPYRLLMGAEFAKEDIISFVRFTDIAREQEEWDQAHLHIDGVEEWDNPYFGFPQMIRFAFTPNEESVDKLQELKSSGQAYSLSALFKPASISKDIKNQQHKKFIHEREVKSLLTAIDGSSEDSNVFGFLDYENIQSGEMCQHIVMVLPYRASCDAMEHLLSEHASSFKHLSSYEVLNISGVDGRQIFSSPASIKQHIKECADAGKKTITLTVNRMLTGSTVEQWDTMIYLKDTYSPQEYDQAIFRLQNQYIRELVDEDGNYVRENLKPQTLLVDFDPHRLFVMAEHKAAVHNAYFDKGGANDLMDELTEELVFSPVITANARQIRQAEPNDILDTISLYNNNRSITDEAKAIPIDLGILNDDLILATIMSQAKSNTRQGLQEEAYKQGSDDLDIPDAGSAGDRKRRENSSTSESDDDDGNEKRIQTYYQRILSFAFLCREPVISLDDIVEHGQGSHARLAKNLGLNPEVLARISSQMNSILLNQLDYKIRNISTLSKDPSLPPLERAARSLNKFPRLSEAELITNEVVTKPIIDMFPEAGLRQIIEEGECFLDLASKSGEFAVALYQRLTEELGYDHRDIRDRIYSVTTSPVAYEFTRRFYEILDLDIDNIAKFFSNDLLPADEGPGNIASDEIVEIITQGLSFSEIELTRPIERGITQVKFGAVVGNPPYQIADGGAGASARPIYPDFIKLAERLQPRYASFIIPSKWYSGGKNLEKFRRWMLSNPHIKEFHDILYPKDFFPETNNRGGLCFFLLDKSHRVEKDKIRFISHGRDGEVLHDSYRTLQYADSGIVVRNSLAFELLDRIHQEWDGGFLEPHVSSAMAFGFRTYFVNDTKFKKESDGLSDPVRCYARGGKVGFVERSSVKSRTEWIDRWKVFVPESNNIGTELNDDNQNAFVGEPGTLCTESFLTVGADLGLDNQGAENLSRYLKTKFARFLHSLAKVSQHGTRKTYRFVPVLDFGKGSLLDWTESRETLDRQLYDYFGLTDEEQSFIEQSIKPMT